MDPFASAYHHHFRHVDPEWYESFTHYLPGPELLRVLRANVPPTWQIRRTDIWIQAQPPGLQLPEQGWKIHLSATPANCEEVLRHAAAVCVREGVAFKFAADRRLVAITTAKDWAREASGKFITIYPLNEGQFQQVIAALYAALRPFSGPYVLSDRRYRDAGSVYYRYGGIAGQTVMGVNGHRRYMLRSPAGELVPDVRMPYWNPPAWAADPFAPAGEDGAGSALTLHDGRYRIERALSFSVTGGVYTATDLATGRTVVIKEARPHTGMDENGRDAADRLRKEYRLLQRLQGAGVTPAPIDLFSDWEHLFLVEEYIPGTDLAAFVVSASPFARGHAARRSARSYLETLRQIWTHLALALAALHARQIVCGDLSIRNIILTNRARGELRIVDLEGAWEAGVDQPSPWFGTPGYTPPQGVRTQADDIYGLGGVMLATLFPINTLLLLEPAAKGVFVAAAGHDLGLPEPVQQLVLRCMSDDAAARPGPRQIAAALRAPFVPAPPPAPTAIARSDLLATVEGVIEYIRASADPARRDRLFPADPLVFMTNPLSIAYGAVGVAYALQRLTGEVPDRVLSWILSQPVDPESYPPGLYVGSAGVAWGLWELGLHDAALQILRAARRHPLLRDAPDLFYGFAGYGLTCLRFYLGTGDQAWLDQAAEAGEWLLRSRVEQDGGWCWPDPQGRVWPGYPRGAAGIALYLLYLSLATGADRFLHAGRAALAHELARARPLPGGPLSIPRDPAGTPDHELVLSHYWLDGSAGVCTALVRFWAHTRDPGYLDLLNRMVPDMYRKYTSYPGLFRGLSGLGNLLLDAYDFTGRERYLHEAHRVASGVRLFTIRRDTGLAFPGEALIRIATDFGTGSAGIALFLHRLAHAGERIGNFNFTLDQLLHGRGGP